MGTWTILERFLAGHVLAEERMYRGESGVRMKDLRDLFAVLREHPLLKGAPATSDPKVLGGDPDPEGDFITCSSPVEQRVWSKWSRTPEFAKVLGSTGEYQHPGAPRGGTVMKRNWGGRVVYQPGKPFNDYERHPSAMDRYDVLMIGDVTGGNIPRGVNSVDLASPIAGKTSIVVKRIAWSPAIGSFEERKARLEALISGQDPGPLSRRPQPEVPGLPKKDKEKDSEVPVPVPVRRQGEPEVGGTPSMGFRTGKGSDAAAKRPHEVPTWMKGAKKRPERPRDDDEEDKDR